MLPLGIGSSNDFPLIVPVVFFFFIFTMKFPT